MKQALFTTICSLCLSFTTSTLAQTTDEYIFSPGEYGPLEYYNAIPLLGDNTSGTTNSNKPKSPPAKAVGTGPWADGLTHVRHGTQVGRGCVDIQDFIINERSYAYACLSPTDRRFHVVQGINMAPQGYSNIGALKFSENGEVSYVGYERLEICNHKAGAPPSCKKKDPPPRDQELVAAPGRGETLYLGPGVPTPTSEPPPSLPLSLTGGERVYQYWMVNGHPLWKDCSRRVSNGCTMRWNGQSGKRYPSIEAVAASDSKAAYVARLSERDQQSRRCVVFNKQEGETFQKVTDLQFIGNTLHYVAKHANGLSYLVRGTRKEAFRTITNFEVLGEKPLLVGRKDPTPSKSPI